MIKRINKLVISTLLLTSIVSLGVSCQGTNNEENEPIKKVKSIKEQRMDLIKKFYSAYLGIDEESFLEYEEKEHILKKFKNMFLQKDLTKNKDAKLWNYVGIKKFSHTNKFQNDYYLNLQKLLSKTEKIYNDFIYYDYADDVSSLKPIINEWKVFWNKYKYYRLKPNILFEAQKEKKQLYNVPNYDLKNEYFFNNLDSEIAISNFKTDSIKDVKVLQKIANIVMEQKNFIPASAVNAILHILWDDVTVTVKDKYTLRDKNYKVNFNEFVLFDSSIGKWSVQEKMVYFEINIGFKDLSGNIISYYSKMFGIDLSKANFPKIDEPSGIIWHKGAYDDEQGKNPLSYNYVFYLSNNREEHALQLDSWLIKTKFSKNKTTKPKFVEFISDGIKKFINAITLNLFFNPLETWEKNTELKLKKNIIYDNKYKPIFDIYISQFSGFLAANAIDDYRTMFTESPVEGFHRTKNLDIKRVYFNIKKALFKTIAANFYSYKYREYYNSPISTDITSNAKYLLLGKDTKDESKLGDDNLIEWAIAKYKDNPNFEKIRKSFTSVKNLTTELLPIRDEDLNQTFIKDIEKKYFMSKNDENNIVNILNIVKNEWIKHILENDKNVNIQKELKGILTDSQIKQIKKTLVSAILDPYYTIDTIFKSQDNSFKWQDAYVNILETGYLSKFIKN